jgi:hypothetical protein
MRRAAAVFVALCLVAPRSATAQCGIDFIESGIQAYRSLDLRATRDLMRRALDQNRASASPCAIERARAWTYIGASHWLEQQSDSADRSFELAVIQAPVFRPDNFEFPPDITQAFDRVRSSTPSVAVELPDEIMIGPRDEASVPIRLTASTGHSVNVRIIPSGPTSAITIFRGAVAAGPDGLIVRWDGRDAEGKAVPSGRYEIEVVSSQGPTLVRKVVVPLTVESDAPTEQVGPALPTATRPVSEPRPTWQVAALAGAGVIGGALVMAVPTVVSGFPETRARFAVGGAVGLASLVGFARHLLQDAPRSERTSPAGATPGAVRIEGAPVAPTLRIRVGLERREELGA